MKKKLILVPTDFSKVGQTAVNHAVKVAQSCGSALALVHIVPKADMLEEAKARLQVAKKMTFEDYDFKIDTIARVGTIYEDIGDLVDEVDASLVIMGTHGMRGLQFITGSHALRVVTSSKTPVIIVQERQIGENGYDDIVVPLDLHQETKQKLRMVADMAKYFDSRVHIIIPRETDEYLRNQVDRNMKYAESYFEEKGIQHTARISGEKSSNFDEGVMNFATEIDADLICIMNLPENSLVNLIGGNYVQNIITNSAQIPAMLLNPKETTQVSIFGAYTGVG